MAKGRKGGSGESEPEASGAAPGGESAPRKKAAAKAARGLRKQLKRLQRQLADAARIETRRIRKLERARWRRQRLEASLDEARVASSAVPSEEAPKAKAEKAPKAKAEKTPKAKAEKTPKAKATAAAPKPAPDAAADPSAGQDVQAYCLREKRHVQMVDPRPVVTAKGGSALSGTCPSCGAAVYKLVGRPPATT
jgi:hypothetical protein